MARMTAPVGNGTAREETPEEKQKWQAFRSFVREQKPREGGTFLVPGYIRSMTGDPDNPAMPRIQEGRAGTTDKPRAVLDAIFVSTHPNFPGLEWKKTIGLSFFDGRRRDGATSPLRGGMYNVHLAVTGQEPAQSLVKGTGDFDPEEDYCGPSRPLMGRLIYKGRVEEGSQYYGRRGNLTVFLDGVEPSADKVASDWDDDADGISDDVVVTNQKQFVQDIMREAVAAADPVKQDTPPWEDADEDGTALPSQIGDNDDWQ